MASACSGALGGSAPGRQPSDSVTVSLRIQSASAALESLEKAVGHALTADSTVKDEPVTILAKRSPLTALTSGLGSLHGWKWREEVRDGNPVSVLYKPRALALAEEAQQRRWRKGREALRAGSIRVMSQLVEDAIDYLDMSPQERSRAEKENPFLGYAGESGVPMAELMRGLHPEERAALLEAGIGPLGVIASNGAHNAANMQFGARFEDLSPAAQASVSVAFPGAGSLRGTTVGIAAAGGSLGLTVAGLDGGARLGRGLVPPNFPEMYDAFRKAMREFNASREVEWNVLDSEDAQAKLRAKYGLDLEDEAPRVDVQIPKRLGSRSLRFDGVTKRQRIEPFLEAIHAQTGLPVLADALRYASQVTHPWTLHEKRAYTLQEACAELSRNFRRKVRYKSGCLLFATRSYAVAKLYEVPESEVQALVARRKENKGLRFDDLAQIARKFTVEQFETLEEMPKDEPGLQREAKIIRKYKPVFALWHGLDANLRGRVAEQGLSTSEIPRNAAKDFWRICGLSHPTGEAGRIRGGGIRLLPDSGGLFTTFTNGPRPTDPTRELRIPAIR